MVKFEAIEILNLLNGRDISREGHAVVFAEVKIKFRLSILAGHEMYQD